MQFTLYNLTQMAFVPIKITIYVYLLFTYFGLSFLVGFFILVLFIFFNYFLQRKRRANEKEIMEKKDSRMKITTETLNHLKLIKLYSWEDEFSNRIEQARASEITSLIKKWNYTTLSIYLVTNCPIFICIASIGMYSIMTDELKLSNILLLINIFNNIQEPIRMTPIFLNILNETLVGLKRIQVIKMLK